MNKNELAFPFQSSASTNMNQSHSGLTKREYAAIMAMQGLCASWTAEDYPGETSIKTLAKVATDCADSLLEQLNKPETHPFVF